MLFKLVFISHYYHESPRGELFLKHSVFLPLNKTGMRKQGHLNFIYPGGPTAVLSISMLHTVTIKQRITNLGALFDLHVGLWSLLIVSSHFQSDSIIFQLRALHRKQEFVRPRWPYDMRPSVRGEKYICDAGP